MKVYIHKPDKFGFQDDWLFAADTGFKQLGAKIIYIDNIHQVPYALDNILVSFIEDTIEYFKLNHVNFPKPLNIPNELKSFRYRLGKNITFKEAKEKEHPIFIKPAEVLKSFPSGVVPHGKSLSGIVNILDDEVVYVGDVVNMISEYRCFIYKKELVGIKHYSGDFTVFPDINAVKPMIDNYTMSPVAYTLDIAIQEHKNKPNGVVTSIIECNDMWSVGHYGLDPLIYAKMLRDRWFELTGYIKF